MDTRGIDKLFAPLEVDAAGPRPGGRVASGQGVDFEDALKAALEAVNARQQEAERLSANFERGEPGTELHQVMVAMQKANIALQVAIQVRNRLVSAYHDIMNMPV
jgi:flagellar hook-basal body complex protein FliE